MKDKYRIKLENYIHHPRETFWSVQKWVKIKEHKNGYWSTQRSSVAFTRWGAERAAKRALKKLKKFEQWEKIIG